MHPSVSLQSPAKINLFLHVTRRRADGYHEIVSLMRRVSLCDTLCIRLTANARVRVTCDHPAVPADSTNLAHRAARRFFSALGPNRSKPLPGCDIDLTKRIPVAAGLGGGSSNAAAVLLGLNQLLQQPFDREQLMAMGKELGADVPFFVLEQTALTTGIGEVLTPVAWDVAHPLLLVNPGVSLSTVRVYKNLNLGLTKCAEKLKNLTFNDRKLNICDYLCNDLETVSARIFPEIHAIKQALLDQAALGALMSGSGPTVFGLFENQASARAACDQLRGHRNWRVYLTQLLD